MFSDLDFKLDQHREELNVKIDDIYMIMIDKNKKFETAYFKKS